MTTVSTVSAVSAPRAHLDWSDLRALGRSDNGNRWHPSVESIKSYFDGYRSPSRGWPHSYAKAAQTVKFARWLRANDAALADRLNLI